MTDAAYECLRHAVTIARNEAVQSVSVLKHKLAVAGHSKDDIRQALKVWAGWRR